MIRLLLFPRAFPRPQIFLNRFAIPFLFRRVAKKNKMKFLGEYSTTVARFACKHENFLPMIQPPTIDYQPTKPVTYKPAFSIEAAIVVGIPVLAFTIASLVPLQVEQVFAALKLDLPQITHLWLRISRWFI